MHAHRSLALAAGVCLAVAVATGCQSDATSPVEDTPSFGVNNNRPLPVRGWFVGSPLDANEVPWGHNASVTCPAGYSHNSEVRGGGEMSHFGRYELRATICTRLTGLTATEIFLQTSGGLSVITAANGDQVFTDIAGTGVVKRTCSGLTTWDVIGTIHGGTGRFASARGSIRLYGTQVPGPCPAGSDPPRLQNNFAAEGTISNVGH